IFLGIKTWRSNKWTVKNHKPQVSTNSRKMLFLEAYLVGVTNPKAIVFYSALFPQFIEVEQ
ncbi:TPA: LysE family translocator, partial [Vibrio vulnificus]|nr:LysE family transporter [Vibrio vulnificus]